jgi:hypothetical protein
VLSIDRRPWPGLLLPHKRDLTGNSKKLKNSKFKLVLPDCCWVGGENGFYFIVVSLIFMHICVYINTSMHTCIYIHIYIYI